MGPNKLRPGESSGQNPRQEWVHLARLASEASCLSMPQFPQYIPGPLVLIPDDRTDEESTERRIRERSPQLAKYLLIWTLAQYPRSHIHPQFTCKTLEVQRKG